MKKMIALLLALLMVLSLCACGNDSEKANDKPADPTEAPDNRVALDVFAGVTVKFEPDINGFGGSFDIEYDYTKVDYDKSNTDIKAFLEGIEFTSDTYRNLSNGDEIVVNASWSKSTADALGVKLKDISKAFTVEGLYDVYRTTEGLSNETDVIEGIKKAIAGRIFNIKSSYGFKDNHDVSYRYYAAYSKDEAGNPYVTMIYVAAVANLVSYETDDIYKTPFLGYNYLYQQYWEVNVVPQAEESDRVSESGELSGIGGAVKVEEFFLN